MRIKRFAETDLSSEQRVLYDEISLSRSKGRQGFKLIGEDGALEGPFNAMLLAPKTGAALQALGAAIRYGSNLTPKVREGSILMVAAKWSCKFEQAAHEPIALNQGISASELEKIRSGGRPESVDPKENAAFEVTEFLLNKVDLDDNDFERYSSLIGADTIFELSSLIGYYSTLALQMRIFRV